MRQYLFQSVIFSVLAVGSVSAQTFPPSTQAPNGVEAQGNRIVLAGTNTPFVAKGFNSIGIIYPYEYQAATDLECASIPAPSVAVLEHAAAQWATLPSLAQQLDGMRRVWNANTVRFQVSLGALYKESTQNGRAYADRVVSTVSAVASVNFVTIISMQWQFKGCTNTPTGKANSNPNTMTQSAWGHLIRILQDYQSRNNTQSDNKKIVFEVLNEPLEAKVDVYTTAHVNLVKSIRKLAPDNMLIVDGQDWGTTFLRVTPQHFALYPANVAFAAHPYNPGKLTAGMKPSDQTYQDQFALVYDPPRSAGRPLIFTEWNRLNQCGPYSNMAHRNLFEYVVANGIGLLGHMWEDGHEADQEAAQLVDPANDFAPVNTLGTKGQPGYCANTGALSLFNFFRTNATPPRS